MNVSKRSLIVSGTMLVAGMWLLSSCNETSSVAQARDGSNQRAATRASSHSVLSGTRINVSLGGNVSSETANVGDSWHGTVTENVSTQNGTIPAGSDVEGVVTGALAAKRGSRAMLQLGVRSIRVNGSSEAISASSEAVIAGSPRARNLGAIAGSAVAGALIGKMAGNHPAAGAIIGGAAATGVVAKSKGYQVELSSGTVMNFTVDQTVAMR